MRIIAVTSLTDGYCRRAESSIGVAKNPVQASFDAICAYDLASDEIFRGASDKKLRDMACDAATAANRYLQHCIDGGHEVDAAAAFHDKLRSRLLQLRISDRWSNFRSTVAKTAENAGCGYATTKLAKAVDALVITIGDEAIESGAEGRKMGSIFGLNRGFGFIESSTSGETIYFHRTALLGGVYFSSLSVGLSVRFRETEVAGRKCAEDVEVLR
jgi:cold shock CspA family protein